MCFSVTLQGTGGLGELGTVIYKTHHNNNEMDQLPFFDDPFCIECCLGGLETGLVLALFSSRFIPFFPEEVVSLVIGSS